MGAMLSKGGVVLPYSCHEFGHTWTRSCSEASNGVGWSCFWQGMKLNTSFYLLSMLLLSGGKKPDLDSIKKLLTNILRSSIFLGCNGFLYVKLFCVFRRLFGCFSFLSSSFLPSLVANIIAIPLEKSSRAQTYSLHVANVASETLYNMAVSRGVIRPVAHACVIIMAVTLAALFRWYRTTQRTKSVQFKLLTALIGDQERYTSPSATKDFCPHIGNETCFQYSLKALVTKFIYGWIVHAGFSVVSAFPLLVRRPSKLSVLLQDVNNVKFGSFLASMTAIYRAVHCALRWKSSGKSNPSHSIAAGLLAGCSIAFYPNTSVLLFIVWKSIEALYQDAADDGILPRISGFHKLLYSLSTAVLFHAAALEPHNLKPGFWKLLLQLTDSKLSLMNRPLMDEFGAHSSKLLRSNIIRPAGPIRPF